MAVTIEDKKYLLSLKPEDITFDLLVDFFGDKAEVKNGKTTIGKSRFEPSDAFTLEAGEYTNKETVKTTVGLFIYNKLMVERDFVDILGYHNETINGGVLKDIEEKLSKALLNGKIDSMQMATYLDRNQWLGMQLHTVICGSFTMNTLKPSKNAITLRNKLLKENKESIENKDHIVAADIEKKVLKEADKDLDGDIGLDLYKSGARGSFGNNYKTISAMKGPIFNPSTGEYDIMTTNFMEGIKKDDLAAMGNSVITASYPKAIDTATSGYFSKQIMAALQAVQLDKPGSNCGSKGYQVLVITKFNHKDYLYRYIIEGQKLKLLDDSNIASYIGKEVKLRSPMYCIGTKLCSACAGTMYEKLQIENIGLTAARVSSTLMNLSMKKFHDTSLKVHNLDPNDLTT
jgi:hypothetical protein